MTEVRTWLFGLTADEWLELAALGEDSEVTPCCGTLGELRELLNTLATFQAAEDWGWHKSIGGHILQIVEADGDGHSLQNRDMHPRLGRVLDGIRALPAHFPVSVLS
jgi:hypothetical protein